MKQPLRVPPLSHLPGRPFVSRVGLRFVLFVPRGDSLRCRTCDRCPYPGLLPVTGDLERLILILDTRRPFINLAPLGAPRPRVGRPAGSDLSSSPNIARRSSDLTFLRTTLLAQSSLRVRTVLLMRALLAGSQVACSVLVERVFLYARHAQQNLVVGGAELVRAGCVVLYLLGACCASDADALQSEQTRIIHHAGTSSSVFAPLSTLGGA